jgi:RimJ/RimL family protein N-acetyltransferase
MRPIRLETARLELDQPTMADAELITEYCRDPVFEHVMSTPWPYERLHAVSFVDTFVPRNWELDREFTWAIRARDSATLIGVIGFRVPLSMIGFWIGGPHRGNGYMPEALTAVANWLFEGGTETIRWECVVGNAASASVAHSAGFTFTGERPGEVLTREGIAAPAWHGSLLSVDTRAPKPGWPL